MLEYEDILNWEKVQMLKTIPLEGIFRTRKTKSRRCNTCSEYNKPERGMCISVGKINNPDTAIYCSWWKEKLEGKTKTKRCSACGELKPIEAFYKCKANLDGYQCQCSKCAIKCVRERQNENKTNIKSM